MALFVVQYNSIQQNMVTIIYHLKNVITRQMLTTELLTPIYFIQTINVHLYNIIILFL